MLRASSSATRRLQMAIAALSACLWGEHAFADGFSWECDTPPVDAGWIFLGDFCNPERWLADGWYHQRLDMDSCPNEPVGESEYYRRELTDFIRSSTFFVEWRLEGDGPRSDIVGGGPSSMALGNFYGIRYTLFVARDQAKLNRDNQLPIVFVDIKPSTSHVHRLELYGDESYIWFIDGQEVDSGIPEGPFPSFDARITWGGSSWHAPAYNRWNFIRYSVIATDGGGDFDSDGDHDLRDFYHFHECVERPSWPEFVASRPDGSADPGCLWADINGDAFVDLLDFAEFQILASNPP